MQYSNILSLDMEYNQPSQTIIQVGYCIGNLRSGEILESIRRYVAVDEVISEFIIGLTGVTQEHIQTQGKPLQEIYEEMRDLHKKHQCFQNPLTWGGGDSTDLRNALGLSNERFLFGRRWIDCKTIFVSKCLALGVTPQSGLAKSMGRVGLQFQGRKHDGLDDAINTFRLYRHLLGV